MPVSIIDILHNSEPRPSPSSPLPLGEGRGERALHVTHVTAGELNLWRVRAPLAGGLDIELTERCNNACIHCSTNLPADDKRAKVRELTTLEWKDVLRQAADIGVLSVRLTGGEPLLREDFSEIYLYARRLGLKVVIFTNARLITPALAEMLQQIPPLELIEVTVYGMHAQSYDAVTCAPGSYDEFRQGVDRLLKGKIPFVVKSALLPPNKAEREEFESWARTIPWMGLAPTYSMFFDLRGRRDSEAKNRQIRSLRLSPKDGLAALARDEQEYRRTMSEFCGKFIGPPGDRLFRCSAGHTPCIDAFGMIKLCMSLGDPRLAYDLRNGSLREALTVVLPRLREMRATNPEYLRRCARCFLKGLCEQCPGKSWPEHGTLDTPVEYLCQVAHEQARYIGLLAEGERAWEVIDWEARVGRLHKENDER